MYLSSNCKCSYFAQVLIPLVCNTFIANTVINLLFVRAAVINLVFNFTGGTVAFDPSTSEILASATSLHSSLICLTLTFLFYVCVH